MRLIKIGLANIDVTVGALKSNTDKVIEYAKKMAVEQCTIGVFSEQVISGYPSEDLVQWRHFIDGQWTQLERFVKTTKSLDIVFVLGLTVAYKGALYNSAAITYKGKILGLVPKFKLPTYGVFYEQRNFSSGVEGMSTKIKGVLFGDFIFEFPFGIVSIEVCEDIWSSDGPMRRRAYSGAELIINISSSPWRAGIVNTRREVISTRAGDNISTVVYVNQVGGNDSLVFDGGGFINQNGRILLEVERWKDGITTQVIDLDRTRRMRHENTTWRNDQKEFLDKFSQTEIIELKEGPSADANGTIYNIPAYKNFFMPPDIEPRNPRHDYFEDIIEAMIIGLKGYFEKTGAFKRLGIALSGGKDSALTLLIAHMYASRKFKTADSQKKKAMIKDFIYTFSMPTHFNSLKTKNIASKLAQELGVTFYETSIEEQFDAMKILLKNMTKNKKFHGVALQNTQARIRGAAMWNWANSQNGMWLQTGNMSEKAVGYTTIGGDLMGAYSLLGNLPKTVVQALIVYLYKNEKSPYYKSEALKELISTKASAELAPNQKDEADLMPFDILDACYALFVGEKMTPLEVYKVLRSMWNDEELKKMDKNYKPGQLGEWVIKFVKLFRASIFKWVQSPQAVHLGSLDLDRERALQLPVVQSEEWVLIKELENYLK